MAVNIIRTRMGKRDEIVAEVAVPSRKNSRRVIVFLGGMPSVPSKNALLETFAKKGYWVVFPRFRGTWESSGEFLKASPEEDVREVLDTIEKGIVKDLWSQTVYTMMARDIYVVGVSFGGAAALLASLDARVKRVIAISPVVDWRAPSKQEPLEWLYGFVWDAFGQGYRVSKRDWNKLARGEFYNPIQRVDEVDGSKVWIIHTRDDESVTYRPVEKFARHTGAQLSLFTRGGHLSSSILFKRASLEKKVWEFLHG